MPNRLSPKYPELLSVLDEIYLRYTGALFYILAPALGKRAPSLLFENSRPGPLLSLSADDSYQENESGRYSSGNHFFSFLIPEIESNEQRRAYLSRPSLTTNVYRKVQVLYAPLQAPLPAVASVCTESGYCQMQRLS